MFRYVSDESVLPVAAIEPVPESCVSTVEDKKLEDIEKWWKMGLKAILDGKLVVLLLSGGRTEPVTLVVCMATLTDGHIWLEIAYGTGSHANDDEMRLENPTRIPGCYNFCGSEGKCGRDGAGENVVGGGAGEGAGRGR
ncbi:hypothetical protein L6452_30766 [Arctium lappa]|uniref:Uncharacterized protein n=1 Tax=Arctium lappa TaxID=4217 RepID=A0ACB8ZJ22_ARCLA|nr:hypothetical protein L6452_30766 [Arctium lappa]